MRWLGEKYKEEKYPREVHTVCRAVPSTFFVLKLNQ